MRFIFFTILFIFFIKGNFVIGNNKNIDYENLVFEHIEDKKELPSSFINEMLQDEEGYIWFATENGLSKYDAYSFNTFRHNPIDTNSLSNNGVKCILADKSGRIWAGTRFGLNVYNKKTNSFKRFFYDSENKNSLWNNTINDICLDENGNIWIATSEGLNLYNSKEKNISRINIRKHVVEGRSYSQINKKRDIPCRVVFEDKHGKIWVGTWGFKLLKIDPESMNIKQLFLGNEIKDDIVTLRSKKPTISLLYY